MTDRSRFRFSRDPLAIGLVAAMAALGPNRLHAFSPQEESLRKSIPVLRVRRGPVLDGILEADPWRSATPGGPLVQVEPLPLAAPTERTEFRVLHDGDQLYVGISCFDREVAAIVAAEMARDGDLPSDDSVTVVLDTFLDRRNAYLFRVNPNGARMDGLIADGNTLNLDWDGIWSVRTRVDALGWHCEIAIPLDTLGFDPGSDRWGLNVERVIRRKNETDRWTGARPDLFVSNVAHAGDLTGMSDLGRGWGLQLTPYVLGRYRDKRLLGDTDFDSEVGLDLRYSIAPNLTASLSYNTDFAETEVDARQINLTRFPLFFPEKREFFLQDEGIFQFAGGQFSKALIPFFSRRIGLDEDGEVVPILVAAKLSGRVGDTNVGVLDAVLDEQGGRNVQNTLVGRVSRNVLESSSVGAIFTYGDPETEQDDLLAGVDFNFRKSSVPLFDDSWEIFGSLFGLGTYREASGGDDLSFGGKVNATEDSWVTSLGVYQIGDDFDPSLGFVPRRGIRGYENEITFRPRTESLDWLRRYFVSYFNSHETDLDNELETALHSLTPVFLLLESGDEIFFNTHWQFDSPDADFEIHPGVVIPPDDYWFPAYRFGVTAANKRPVSGQLTYTFGDFYDGSKTSWSLVLAVKPVKHLRVELAYELNEVRLPEGDFDTRLASARLQLSFTPEIVWSTFVQYDNITDRIGIHSRIHWEFRPGADFYLVLNQLADRKDGRLRVEESEWTTKLGVAFRF